MVAYCTANQVAAFLQVADFSGSTTPTTADVESFIEMAEERVDQLTDHAWATARAKSVTEERVRIQRVRSNALSTRGRIQLSHYPILDFSQHASPSLAQTNGNVKIWNGSKYLDYLDSDESKTLGGSVTDVVNKDMWSDGERGVIYLEDYTLFESISDSPSGVDGYVSYKYATASTPDDIKQATIYFTASMIAMNDDLNLMQEGDDSMDNSTKSQRYEDMAMKILKDGKRLGRTMPMARAIGGFAVGRSTI
jgi:hypothetical protein|tara:strand:+ start:51 stop:803 length:753 start_codon:yes stop_codon:yes gene_type:complete